MKKKSGYTWKLGVFVTAGLAMLVFTIYYIGKQKNLFGSTFHLRSEFKTVGGLKVGNHVRFSGINVGTVNEIDLITDSSVMVDILVRTKYQEFIKTNARTSIGSDGLMGDKVLTISPGSSTDHANNRPVKNNDLIASKIAVEMEDVMNSLKGTVDNAGIITAQLAQFSVKMNNGNGPLSKLISDESLSRSLKSTLFNLEASSHEFATFTSNLNDGELGKALDSTMVNIQGATKGLNDNMEAVQSNFLLKGFFNKKKKAEAKRLADLKKQEDKRKKEEAKKAMDSIKAIKTLSPATNVNDSIKL